jgi:hypothetical protein
MVSAARETSRVTEQGCGCGCTGPAGVVKRFLSDQEDSERLDSHRQESPKQAGEVRKRNTALRAKG